MVFKAFTYRIRKGFGWFTIKLKIQDIVLFLGAVFCLLKQKTAGNYLSSLCFFIKKRKELKKPSLMQIMQ